MRCLQIELLEIRLLLASDWQHPFRLRDVSDDGAVTPLDALVGINRLNTVGASELAQREVGSREPYFDVNGDSFHSAIDVLIVINALNNGPLVDARLANDTGSGPNSNRDLVTNDFSVMESIRGRADVLSAQIAGRDKLFDLSDSLRPDGSFLASSSKLEELLGETLVDGDYSILLSARGRNQPESEADRVGVRFTLDRTRPQARYFGEQS